MVFISIIILSSCRIHRPDIVGHKYSTGYLGMPGEYAFVFKNEGQFYYYERLYYSEGTYVWTDSKTIMLMAKPIGFDIPSKGERWFKHLSNKKIVVKRKKVIYDGLIFRQIE